MVEKSTKSFSAAQASAADPADPSFRLDESPFYWINRVSGSYALELSKALKPIGMDVGCWRVLMILTERGRSGTSALAEEAVFRLPTMTKTVQRMAAANLVTTAPSKTDRRVTEVELTAAGAAQVERVREAASITFRKAFAGIDADDQAQLIRIMTQVFAQLGTSG